MHKHKHAELPRSPFLFHSNSKSKPIIMHARIPATTPPATAPAFLLSFKLSASVKKNANSLWLNPSLKFAILNHYCGHPRIQVSKIEPFLFDVKRYLATLHMSVILCVIGYLFQPSTLVVV